MDIPKTYLFYDLETTGLNKCFDQILQFAAVRTDLKFNELERHVMQIRLNCDVLPSPAAIITHRIGITEMRSGKSEIEAIREIHRLLNVPGTISVGYNSLGFDDEFLRFSFYRNLLPPYTHQYQNHCARVDLYPITALYFIVKNETLSWPNHQGKVTLKLEFLSQLNQLSSGPAHTAIVDVQACVALAKKFHEYPDLWERSLSYFDRKSDTQRIQQLPLTFKVDSQAYQEAVLMHGRFGIENLYQIPAVNLGKHQHYQNQWLWLALDHPNLSRTTPNTIPNTTYVIRKRSGEPPFVLPPSQYPLAPERAKLVNENKHWLRENPQLFHQIREYHQQFTYPNIPQQDINATLYSGGFPTPHEEFLFHRFHHARPAEKEAIAIAMPNAARREQALRIMGRHYATYLSPKHKELFDHYVENAREQSLLDHRGEPSLTISMALQEINRLEKENFLDEQQKQLLADFRACLENTEAKNEGTARIL